MRCGAHSRLALLLLGLAVLAAGCHRARPAEQTAAPARLPNRVVHVLCYHNLCAQPKGLYDTSLSDFTAQLAALKTWGGTVVTARQVAAYLAGEQDLPDKAVVITFDDGYRSVYTVARPILDRLGYKATLFLITDCLGGKTNLTWTQVKEMAAAGYDIGSHTATHPNLTRARSGEAAAQREARAQREIQRSYDTLEEKLGTPPAALAYPFGNYDAATMQAVSTAGFRVAFSIDPGAADQDSTALCLPRKMIVKGTSLRTFQRFLDTAPLHLAEVTPAVGERVKGRQYQLTARVSDPDAVAALGGECGSHARVKLDPQTSLLTLTASLNRGANLVRIFSSGTPRRETGWIVVCDP